MQEIWVQSTGREDPLENEMATQSNILAWRNPWTEEPGGLQSMGCKRVGLDLATKHTNTCRLKQYVLHTHIQTQALLVGDFPLIIPWRNTLEMEIILYIPHVIDWFRLRWQIDISQISGQFRDGEMGSSSRLFFFFSLSQDLPDSPQSTQGTAARLMRIFKGRTEWHDGNGGWGTGNSMARCYTGSGCWLSYTINLLKMLRRLNKIKRIQMWKKVIVIGYSRTRDQA